MPGSGVAEVWARYEVLLIFEIFVQLYVSNGQSKRECHTSYVLGEVICRLGLKLVQVR